MYSDESPVSTLEVTKVYGLNHLLVDDCEADGNGGFLYARYDSMALATRERDKVGQSERVVVSPTGLVGCADSACSENG